MGSVSRPTLKFHMQLRIYKIAMLVLLILLAAVQALFLFQAWTKIPRQDISKWHIEFANLRLDEETNPNHTLQLQLRVDAPTILKKVTPPHIELLLTNIGGETIAFHDFAPSEWIPNTLPLKNSWLTEGVASQTEITVAIPLEVPGDASGFQVHMLYH